MINYNSALKVVNLGEPEASLILRKPRSPHGAGGADPSSPTGLTHVGGSRWESTESPAYRAILDWIREAVAIGRGACPGRNLLGRQLLARLRAGPGRRRRSLDDLAHRVCRRQPRLPARAGRRPGHRRARSKGCSTFPARIAPTAASGTSRSGPQPTASPWASHGRLGAMAK